MAMVVVRDAVVHPRTVTVYVSPVLIANSNNLLVSFRNAAVTPLAMLTPQRFPHHAVYAKVVLLKLPRLHKLINDRLRGTPAG
jgi:hypothetical protein